MLIVNGERLFQEIVDAKILLEEREKITSPLQLINFLVEYGESNGFPKFIKAVQLMLTIAVSVTSCERSFSKLKLILTNLRSTMSQDKLNALATLSIEKDIVNKLNFEKLIDRFAS